MSGSPMLVDALWPLFLYGTVVLAIGVILLLVVQHRYVLGITGLVIAFSGPMWWALARWRARRAAMTKEEPQ